MVCRNNCLCSCKRECSYLIDGFCRAFQQGTTLISRGPFLELRRLDQNLHKLNLDRNKGYWSSRQVTWCIHSRQLCQWFTDPKSRSLTCGAHHGQVALITFQIGGSKQRQYLPFPPPWTVPGWGPSNQWYQLNFMLKLQSIFRFGN